MEGQEGPQIHGAEPVEYLARGGSVQFPVFAGFSNASTMGTLQLTWQDDDGGTYDERQTVRF
ncbi:hypothetical protein ACI797_08190 [Geodermatophilus sp. SYSU D00691]